MVDLFAHLNKRTSFTVRRNLVTFFAFAFSIAASFTPARAVVPAAPAWARSAEINQLVIKVESEKARKARRQEPGGVCVQYRTRADCENIIRGCLWQKGTLFLKGYCYLQNP